MGNCMCSSSWVARYDSDGEITNGNEIYEARSKALNEGCSYLLKIRFVYAPDVIIEEALSDKETALEFAKIFTKYKSAVKYVVVCLSQKNCFAETV